MWICKGISLGWLYSNNKKVGNLIMFLIILKGRPRKHNINNIICESMKIGCNYSKVWFCCILDRNTENNQFDLVNLLNCWTMSDVSFICWPNTVDCQPIKSNKLFLISKWPSFHLLFYDKQFGCPNLKHLIEHIICVKEIVYIT